MTNMQIKVKFQSNSSAGKPRKVIESMQSCALDFWQSTNSIFLVTSDVAVASPWQIIQKVIKI